MTAIPDGALAGLRVLDISTFLSAPQIATFLADFGADVIKVEPPGGEALRRIGAQRNGESLVWAMTSRNKRCITLDIDTDEGREVLHRLIGQVDVFLHNHSAKVLEAWGCTWADVARLNPGCIMVSVSCYGTTGPLADRPGAGTLAEAFGGLTHLTGEADGAPMLSSIPLGDTLTAISGIVGVLVACYHRLAHDAPGQHVDVTMYEPILTLLGSTLVAWRPEWGEPPPHRYGSQIETGAPRNVYRAADNQWIVLSGTTDRQVERILAVIGQDTPEHRERFGTGPARLRHRDELDALVARWIGSQSQADALAAFVAARIPVTPVHDLPGLLADPHVAARGSITEVDAGPALGRLSMATPSPVLSATPGTIRHPGPAVGAHNAEVYAELLGWDDAELAARHERGVL